MESVVLVANIAVIPAICLTGLIGNVVNLTVLLQPEMKRSQYVYLTVMSITDIITLCLAMVSSFGQSYGHDGRHWAYFDAHIYLPVGCVTTSISVASMTIYTMERFIYSRRPIAARRWCQRPVAKKVAAVVVIVVASLNIPYFFALYVDENDKVAYTEFAKGCYYEIHNWIRLLIFGVLAYGILLFVNGCIISTLSRAHRLRQALFAKNYINQEYRLKNRIRVIRVIVTIIILFTVGELPTHFISRTSVNDFVFRWLNGYEESEGFEQITYKMVRAVSTALMCCHYTFQFICYTAFDILYCRVFKQLFCQKRKCCNACFRDQTERPPSINIISAPS